ncbi:hypothetical protein Agsp01_00210 [Agromyces sp. NBRC 114283]|nr:hypothetical protein Agsp01_00210 [Agromyces sp. NBRC 114283]
MDSDVAFLERTEPVWRPDKRLELVHHASVTDTDCADGAHRRVRTIRCLEIHGDKI